MNAVDVVTPAGSRRARSTRLGGGGGFEFVTFDHVHGAWSKRTGEVTWHTGDEALLHWASCTWNFPDEPRSVERLAAQANHAAALTGAPGLPPVEAPVPGLPEHLCGANDRIEWQAWINPFHVVCAEEIHHYGQHRCGSVSWPNPQPVDKPVERYL